MHPRHGGGVGFGRAVERAIDSFEAEGSPVSKILLLAGEHFETDGHVDELHGCRILRLGSGNRLRNVVSHLGARIDVILSIDYRPSYTGWFMALPRVPVVVWVRGPRTPEDWRRTRTLRIPGKEDPW